MRIRMSTVLMAFLMPISAVEHAQQSPMSIEVFAFELEDKSAGAGIIPPDEHDRRYIAESTQVAKDMLAQSGQFTVIDAPAMDQQAVAPQGDQQAAAPHGLRNCGGCEGRIAKQHGASLALLGVVTRVNRTEHTMFIRILDAETRRPVSEGFTGLRMGGELCMAALSEVVDDE